MSIEIVVYNEKIERIDIGRPGNNKPIKIRPSLRHDSNQTLHTPL